MPAPRCLSLVVLIGVAITGAVWSQDSRDVDRSQLLRVEPGLPVPGSAAAGEALGYAAPSENDADLGIQAILKRQNQYRPFTFSLSTPLYYTTNVALTREGEVQDGIVGPAVTLAYQPHIARTLYGEFLLVQQLFYYERYSSFNFTSLDGIAGVVCYLPQFYGLSLRARYDFNRLTDEHFNEFFQNHSLVFSAEMPFPFRRAMQATVGTLANISLAADPSGSRRNDFEIYAGYQVQFSRSLTIDAVGRFLVKDYYEGDRVDINEILALTANYRAREWLLLSAITTFSWNQSNHSVFDYQVANLGGAVALTLRF